ncbi:M14 family zinc carboxypeptidase [Aquirufa sp. HETE-40SA]
MRNLLSCLLLLFSMSLSAQIKSPDEFLGYPMGTKFTYHHQIVAYSRYLASQSNGLAQWQVYGQTNEGREQGQMIIANLPSGVSLEQVQQNHQKRIQGEKADPSLPVIINLSFNVHGNEAAGSEAALNTLYSLISKSNRSIFYVILIDPCINPDGRDAYVTQYNRRNFISGGNSDPNDQEHYEGITSGRYNHFSFDLNRDWVWQTQKETQQRLKFYRSWMPMMHADFHEQSFQHSYYFPPAAKPYLNFIAQSTKDLQESVGKSFAKLFDEKKWPYFTSEVYDLLYPGYGDTYPVLNGALGMTLEQGGIRGGLISAKSDGDTISLVDRVKHHTALALNLVEWSLTNAESLKASFYGVHDKSRSNPSNKYAYYFVPEEELVKGQEFKQLLLKNNISFTYTDVVKSVPAYEYTSMKQVNLPLNKYGLLISAKQPSAPLIQALLDPTIALEDSLTYDITAWNLFQLNGLKAFGLNENVFGPSKNLPDGKQSLPNEKQLAYQFAIDEYKSSQELIKYAIDMGALVTYNDALNKSGMVTITSLKLTDLQRAELIKFATNRSIQLNGLNTFKSTDNYDLGSTHYKSVFVPKIAVIVDPANDVNQQGEIAYFLTQKYGFKPSFIAATQLFKSNLFNYTHIIYPDGKHAALSNTNSILLTDWVKKGGKLILMEGARKIIEDKDLIAKEDTAKHTSTYAMRERAELSNTSSGNILQVDVEKTHPLVSRINEASMYILNQVSDFVKLPKDFTPVLKTSSKPIIMGFVGSNKKAQLANSLLLGVKEVDKGKIIWFGFNPLFRAIPNQGQTIFENCFLYTEF